MKFNLPRIWVPKKFGIVSIVDWTARIKRMVERLQERQTLALANAAEGFHPGGLSTYYPIDVPYTIRYLMVSLCPSNTALPAGLSILTGFPVSQLCQQYATNRLAIPLGICTDEPDNTALDSAPFSTNVTLLGSAQGRTQIGVTDGVIAYNTLLVGSATTAGYLTSLPSTPGSYWSPGLSLTTSEGNAAQIEFDPRIQVVNVDVIT